jgi:hypothetical protein
VAQNFVGQILKNREHRACPYSSFRKRSSVPETWEQSRPPSHPCSVKILFKHVPVPQPHPSRNLLLRSDHDWTGERVESFTSLSNQKVRVSKVELDIYGSF